MANRLAKLCVNVKLLEFPICWPMNDLGAEGCCLSQNTLLSLSFDRKVMGYYRMVDADVLDPTNEYHTRPPTVTMLTSITDSR